MSSDAFATLEAEAAELARLTKVKGKVKPRPVRTLGAPLVAVRNLHVRFGSAGVPVLRGVNFSLRRGECLALVGESGSGKSVTSRTLLGLAGPAAHVEADQLSVGGEDLRELPDHRWRTLRGARIGFVMQDALGSLDPLRTVGDEIDESLRLHTKLRREERARKVVDLLRSVGMPEPEVRARQYPHQLSGGLRQRALIASAIACGPELLIADEPTTALDAAVQVQVLELLASLRTPHNAMIVVSHDFAVVSHLADSVAVMHQGQIVEQGPIETVLGSPQHPYTRSLLEAVKAVHTRGRPVESSRDSAASVRLPLFSDASGVGLRSAVTVSARPLLEVRGLTKAFVGPDRRSRTAVANVSFDLHPGETLGIVGESGSGKTTTIRMVLGLEKPDAGHVVLEGYDFASLSGPERRLARRKMQVVFQDPLGSFDPRYTVERVLAEALEVAGVPSGAPRRAGALRLLELVRLDASYLTRRPLELSGGQRQRLAIARALAPDPKVLVCDEPVSALDVSVQKQILDLLSDLKTKLGLSCLFISHDLGVIQRISDRVLVMKDGVVVEEGAVAGLFAHPQHPYTQTLLSAIPAIEFLGNAIDI